MLQARHVAVWAWLAACLPASAMAAFPSAYSPIVVQPVPTSQARQGQEFDLTPALKRARRDHKRLYVYLGASDCAYCRRYESFLQKHAAELVASFAKDYLVVDLRSQLSIDAPRLFIKVNDRSLPYADFQRSIGDERARMLVYPSVWLFDADAKPLMQMPAGAGTFETVPEQLEILRLEQ